MIRELETIRAYIARMNVTNGKENDYEDSQLRYKADAALDMIYRELGFVIAQAEMDVYSQAKALAEKELKR